MTTITIKQYGDKVFFLNDRGFKKGFVCGVHVCSNERNPLSITYQVKEDGEKDEFRFYPKLPSEIWDTQEEMIKHFTKKTLN